MIRYTLSCRILPSNSSHNDHQLEGSCREQEEHAGTYTIGSAGRDIPIAFPGHWGGVQCRLPSDWLKLMEVLVVGR